MISPVRLIALLVGALLCALPASAALAERFPRQLEDIHVYGKGEEVRFEFSQPYEGRPVIEHKPGYLGLSFSGTGSEKPIQALRPVDESSLFREIKVVENRYSTTVAFYLRDRGATLADRLTLDTGGKTLTMHIALPGGMARATAAPTAAPAGSAKGAGTPAGGKDDGALFEQVRGLLGQAKGDTGGKASQPVAGYQEHNFYVTLLTMVVALVLIVGGLYGVLFLYNRFVAHRLRRFTGQQAIRQVASFHVGTRQRIVVLEVQGEKIVCGVSPNQITYLTHLGGRGPVARRPGGTAARPQGTPPAAGGSGPATPARRTKEAPATESAPAGDAADPVQQFAEVLKQKVRSLKRIH